MKYQKLFIVLAVFLASCVSKQPDFITDKAGTELPSFPILLPDSATVLNTKQIKSGKPFVVFVFGPQCPYSIAQVKTMVANSKNSKGVQVYAITPYSFSEMKQFYSKYSLEECKNITVGQDVKDFYAPYMNIQGVPYIAFYDANKKLQKAHAGVISYSELKENLQ